MSSLLRSCAAAALALMCFSTHAAAFDVDELRRVQAYEGPALPRSEVAVLFAMDGRPHYESTTICAVDGVPVEKDGVCAAVVYVRPGAHRIKLRYRSSGQFGSGTLPVEVEANRLYQVNFSSLIKGYSATMRLIPMPDGRPLDWRHLAPSLMAGDPRIDQEVPYAANSVPGEPVVKPPLTDADRANLDRLMSCAGAFSMDLQVRRLDHQEFASGYNTMNAFVQAALSYVSEDEVLEARQKAVRDAAVTYADARVALDAATEASTRARARLKADVDSCTEFYSTNASERVIRTQGRPQVSSASTR